MLTALPEAEAEADSDVGVDAVAADGSEQQAGSRGVREAALSYDTKLSEVSEKEREKWSE
jgi:hypothetical protein